MTYDFTSQQRDFGRIVFAMTLDRKKLTERIVIARSEDARIYLERGTGNIYYDATRSLGSLLTSFESDKRGDWNKHSMILRESYSKIFPRESARWKMAKPVSAFLKEKYDNGEPSAMFAAVKTWDEYLNCYNLNRGADLLTERLSMLYKPWQDKAQTALNSAIRDGESAVELWYPVAKRPFECIVTSNSFLPIIAYYLRKVEEWGLVFQHCKVCGKDFLARSRHYELCSDKCRKVQAKAAKRDFDERAKGDRLEQLDEAAYYYWYNRLRKMRTGKAASPTMVAAFKVKFDEFRSEAKYRKARVKRGEAKLSNFASWLAGKQNEADDFIDNWYG